MRKKAIAAGVGFALISTMTLTQAVFAAPPEKQADKQTTSHSPPPKKAKAESDVEQDRKVSICHNGNIISVDEHALRGHGIDSIVGEEGATAEESSSGAPRGHKKHTDTLVSDAAIAEGGEDVAEGTCQGESAQPEELPDEDAEQPDEDEEAAAQEETEQLAPEGTTGASREAEQEEQEEQAEEEVKTCDGESIELSKEEKLTLDLHNETRKENELKELCVDSTLQKAARAHTVEMIKEDYFGHNSRDGKTSGQRLKGLGYNWRATGENLARGSGSLSKPRNRFEAWMRSDEHRGNILNEKYEEVGIGIASGQLKEGGQKQTVYTVDFATKKKK